jgi:hypothetical protein
MPRRAAKKNKWETIAAGDVEPLKHNVHSTIRTKNRPLMTRAKNRQLIPVRLLRNITAAH